jgi:N-acetylglucosamine-6-sulfatase
MRRLVAALAAIVLLASACTSSRTPIAQRTASGTAQARPNFVFVLTDDLSMNLISHMPQVRALQAQGTTMSNYYVVDSLCCPSRSAIFTGEYPHDDGVFTNHGADGGYGAFNRNGNEQKSFGVALQKAGYRTGFMGKYLNDYQPGDPVPPGWDEWDVAGNGYQEYDYNLNENGHQHHYGTTPGDYMVDVLSQKAGQFIDSAASGSKPFALEVATFAPHGPYTPPPRYAHAAQDLAYPRTPLYDALPTDPPSWLTGRPPLTLKQQRVITTAYRKRVEADLAVDDLIEHIRLALQENHLAANTYIVFSSDNGYHMGEYRLMPGKQTPYDTDIHVPLIVAGPGVPAGHTDDHLVSNVDLAPTFETLGGAKVGAGVDGLSLDRLWHGQPETGWPQAVLVEHHGPDNSPDDPDRQNRLSANPPSYEAVRSATGLYVRYASGEEEYYDTATDPGELHNLGGAAAPASLRTALVALENCHDAAACRAAAQL